MFRPPKSVLLASMCLMLAMASVAPAHEGHAALPTKGADVDVAKGTITLSKESRDALGVQTADVQLRALDERVLGYVRLAAPWDGHAFVTSRVPGRIVALHVRPGERVVKGQTLAEVHSPELESLQLNLINAQNDALLSKKLLEHLEALSKEQITTARQTYEAQSKHRENINAVEMARIKLLSLGFTTETLDEVLRRQQPRLIQSLPILSPLSGTINHADLTLGKVIQTTEHLFEIVDLTKVLAKVDVLESDIHKIEVGQSVEITLPAYRGEVFKGTVHIKGAYLDPVTHLSSVWTELTNPPDGPARLLPGMFGQAQIDIAVSRQMLTVPASALIRDGAERYLLVEEAATAKASEYKKRNVIPLRETSQYAQIQADSVYAGDRVVTIGSHELFGFFVQGVLQLSPEAAKNIGLRVESVGRHAVEEIVEVDGIVDVPPTSRDFASSQLPGTIYNIRVEHGQTVQAGDVLAEVASLQLQDLQLDLLKAQLQLELLDATLKRLRTLDDSQVLARRQLWEMESQHSSTLNRRNNLQRQLETIGLSPTQIKAILSEKKLVERVPIRATIDGVVVRFDKVLGQIVQEGETIFEIHKLSRAWVEAFLAERDLARIQSGQRARLRFVAYPNFIADAVVVRSGQVLGAENRTLAVWLELTEQPSVPLLHSMLARISLSVSSSPPSVAVPLSALVSEGTRRYVFVQKPDGKFERHAVELGRSDDRFAEIKSGVQTGEKIAAWGTAELQTAYASLK